MDELCALEREEALRRAEYEARHAEALRRAESQSRHLQGVIDHHSQPRLSKSATTSPIMRDGLTLTALNDPLGPRSESPSLSPTLSGHPGDYDSFRVKSKRRLSGPAWMLTPQDQTHQHPTIPQSRSSGHLVETMLHITITRGPSLINIDTLGRLQIAAGNKLMTNYHRLSVPMGNSI